MMEAALSVKSSLFEPSAMEGFFVSATQFGECAVLMRVRAARNWMRAFRERTGLSLCAGISSGRQFPHGDRSWGSLVRHHQGPTARAAPGHHLRLSASPAFFMQSCLLGTFQPRLTTGAFLILRGRMTTHTAALTELVAAHQAARDELDRLMPSMPDVALTPAFDTALAESSRTAAALHKAMKAVQSRPE